MQGARRGLWSRACEGTSSFAPLRASSVSFTHVQRQHCFPLVVANSYAKARLGSFEPQILGKEKAYDFTSVKEEIWKKIPDLGPESRSYIPPDAHDDEDDYIFDGKVEWDPQELGSQLLKIHPVITPKRLTTRRNIDGVSAYGKGGRKNARAVAWIKPGTGKVTVNGGRTLLEYWPLFTDRDMVLSPFVVTERIGKFDVDLRVAGGGVQGQAGAARHAIANALQAYDIAFRPVLKAAGFLKRDRRVVERKHTGKLKARKSSQWSKR